MEGKGIVQQIEERGNTYNNDGFSKKDLENYLNDLAESKVKRNKILEENRNHLIKRSKELKEDIPMELWAFMYYPYYLSGDIIRKHTKWFREETMLEKVNRIGEEKFNEWLNEYYIEAYGRL